MWAGGVGESKTARLFNSGGTKDALHIPTPALPGSGIAVDGFAATLSAWLPKLPPELFGCASTILHQPAKVNSGGNAKAAFRFGWFGCRMAANAGFAVNERDVAIGLLYDDENGVALGSFGGWEKMGTVLIPHNLLALLQNRGLINQTT